MKFSLPSIQHITTEAYQTLSRFPFVILCAVVASCAAVWYFYQPYDVQTDHPQIFKMMFVGFLGISWMYASTTFAEQQTWSTLIRTLFNLTSLIVLIIYYALLKDDLTEGAYLDWYRLVMLFLIAHLFAAYAPFISAGSVDQFWEYNKTIFLRFLLSGIYTGFLYVGLSVALIALDVLLGFDIDERTYLSMFFILAGIFNTWFFLAGVPDAKTIQTHSIDYPKGLRVFVQFVLIPLVTAYILILYAYLAKILIEWELPNGWVTYLVLSFSIVGILALLLLHPVKEDSDKQWIKWFSTGYYRALIPLVVLLLFSIWVRIDDYGVTINRFIVATLGVWLTLMVLYFIISKSKSIMVIPISLCVITLGAAFGPFSAFSVSESSQLHRFEEILSEQSMITESGIAVSASEVLELDTRKELSSIVTYLTDHHGIEVFQPYFETSIETVVDDSSYQKRIGYYDPGHGDAASLLASLNVELTNEWVTIETMNQSVYFEFTAETGVQQNIGNYDYFIAPITVNTVELEYEFEVGDDQLLVRFDPDKFALAISLKDVEESELTINILNDIDAFKYTVNPSNYYKDISLSEMTFETENDWLSLRVIMDSLSGMMGDEQQLNRAKFNLYVRIVE
ncbi:MAG: DUF4153 domain-containing protein [Balneolaceae bacterium]|nr:DUF4153 domain-containing protein [Balneolaceae bacterium]